VQGTLQLQSVAASTTKQLHSNSVVGHSMQQLQQLHWTLVQYTLLLQGLQTNSQWLWSSTCSAAYVNSQASTTEVQLCHDIKIMQNVVSRRQQPLLAGTYLPRCARS
jgi:hypothetical protein